MPWWVKLPAKLVLSRMPATYAFWQRIGLFKHGFMEDPAYCLNVFRKHFGRVSLENRGAGFTVLELGPGDSLATALVAAAHGASRVYLVDVGRFARGDIAPYLALHAYLQDAGLTPPDITGAANVDGILAACNATYLTEGLESLRSLPSGSVDLIFSNAVLEHVRRAEVQPVLDETARLLAPGGASSHSIDLKDHLGGGLANLRFADRTWETGFMSRSGFYTNRLRRSDFERAFAAAGLPARIIHAGEWERIPITRRALAPQFRQYDDQDLRTSDIDVVTGAARTGL